MSTTEETQRYWTVLTEMGEAEYTLAQLEDRKVPYTYLVLGDGGGFPVEPSRTQTGLVNVVHRAPITAAYTKANNPNWLYLETVVPASTGGFWVREIGAETSTGKLVAVGNYPSSYKPTLEDNGLARDLKITFVVETTGSAAPTLALDPSLIFATLASIVGAMQEHNADPEAHQHASTEEHGFAKLATIEQAKARTVGEVTPSAEVAVTPAGLDAAMREHEQSRDGHAKATTELFGFTRLATLDEQSNPATTRQDIAVTPMGLQGAINALVSAMPDDSMPAHLQALDPHSQYFNDARLGTAFAFLMGEHLTEVDPHSQYFNDARLSALLASRDKAGRARRTYFSNF